MNDGKTLTYSGHDFDLGTGVAEFRFRLEENVFVERIHFEMPTEPLSAASAEATRRAVENLYLVAGTSYFNLTFPTRVMVVGSVSENQVEFLRQTFKYGLAQTAAENGLDLPTPDIDMDVLANKSELSVVGNGRHLVAFSGGKDSFVTLDCLRKSGEQLDLYFTRMNGAELPKVLAEAIKNEVDAFPETKVFLPTRFLDTARIADFVRNEPSALKRGRHVPITAFNVLIATAQAIAFGSASAVFSNERTASEPTRFHRGEPVNHQWSKGREAELLLNSLLFKDVAIGFEYTNLLGGLSEVGIAGLFNKWNSSKYKSFCSCNKQYFADHRRVDWWCNACAKCAFVFLCFSAFRDRAFLSEVWGRDLLDQWQSDLEKDFRDILGLTDSKPLDCTGSIQESRVALSLAARIDPSDSVLKLCDQIGGVEGQTTEADVEEIFTRSVWQSSKLLNQQRVAAYLDSDVR
jgi:UDP-N-acetyl-alpha-D-muramoyl-L-alanyl-L-glutamate epimerase